MMNAIKGRRSMVRGLLFGIAMFAALGSLDARTASAQIRRFERPKPKPTKPVTPKETVVIGDLMWTVRDNRYDLDWNEAKAYCEECRVGGYSDWRMPTIGELGPAYERHLEPGDRAALWAYVQWLRSPAAAPDSAEVEGY